MNFDQEIWLSNTSVAPGKLRKFTINVDEKVCEDTIVDESSCEFPTTHPYRNGFAGTRFNYVMANARTGQNLPYRDVVKVSRIGIAFFYVLDLVTCHPTLRNSNSNSNLFTTTTTTATTTTTTTLHNEGKDEMVY